MTDRIAVIGGGLGGLAAAAVLGARGHKVTLFDKNDWIGGKAAVKRQPSPIGDFRFDMGPTILTVPAVLERIFGEAGESVYEKLDLVRLDPQWRCFFEDGGVLDLREDVKEAARAIEAFAPGISAGAGYEELLKLSEHLHGVSERFFLWKAVEDLRDTMDFKASLNASTLSDVMSLRMGQSVAGVIRKHVKDERVSQMLDHYTQYVGSSPFASPAVLTSIAHMQSSGGVWYPMGGTRAVAEGLMALGRRHGVDYRPSTEITGLDIENDTLRAVVTDSGERVPVSAAVSNMDAIRTYAELVGGDAARRYAKATKGKGGGSVYGNRNYEPACSGVVLYLGLNKAYDHLAHHDFVFSRDAEEEFDAIYEKGEVAPDPTAYLAAPSSTDPSVAPEGGEALYVLVHAPHLRPHHDWSKMFPEYRQRILDKLKRTAGMEDIEDRIVCESHLTPQDIHDRYKVLDGAIYGLASHGKFMGAFKPGNRSRDVKGLYLAGGAANPGPGMPMVMMSGWIAADALDQDMGGRGPMLEAAE